MSSSGKKTPAFPIVVPVSAGSPFPERGKGFPRPSFESTINMSNASFVDPCLAEPHPYFFCRFLVGTSPFVWAGIGTGIAIALSVVGAAWYDHSCYCPDKVGVSLLQEQVSSALVLRPRESAPKILSGSLSSPLSNTQLTPSIIFCEAVAIYGIISAIIFYTRMDSPVNGAFTLKDYQSGYRLMAAGLVVGLSNFASG